MQNRTGRVGTTHPPAGGGQTAEKGHTSGLVTNVVDANTLDLKVNGTLGQGDAVVQRIVLAGDPKPGINTLPGILAKLDMEKKMTGRRIDCEIVGRDAEDHLLAQISTPLPKSRFTLDI